MADSAPPPDLPAEGSGADYSTSVGDRTAGAWEAFQAQQQQERLLGGVLILGAIILMVLAAWFWRNRQRIAENAAQKTIRTMDPTAAKTGTISAWWRKQAEKARTDRK